jgi:acetolactate synthase-1/2/3 large subunit
MAFGYAKSTGKPGVYTVVPGPGFLNSSAALCTAQGAGAPVMCLTGQVPSRFIGSGKGALHELPDQLATMRTLTKWAERIAYPSQAPERIAEAFKQMLSGRPGAVGLEMPWDVGGMKAAVESPMLIKEYPAPPVDTDQIQAAVDLLQEAKNPMIMVGSGAQHASVEVLELAQILQAPVVSFRGGRGVVSDEHHLGFNCAEGFQLWSRTDLLIGIGTRMELQWGRWSGQPKGLKFLRIDIDPTEMVRHPTDVGLVADAREATRELANAVLATSGSRSSRKDEYSAVKARTQQEIRAKIQPQIAYLDVIRQVLPRNGFFVEEICQVGFSAYFGLPVYEPRTFVTGGFQGTLGFGFPTALGVKVANPEKTVVSINGDGGFMFGIQDLATAVQYGINLISIVFNNQSFANVRRDQQRFYNGRLLGSDLVNPDFVKLAESFGVAGYRANGPEALKPILEKALSADAPALIEVPIEKGAEASPWQFLMPGTPYGTV